MDRVVFWFVVVCVLITLTGHYGYRTGLKDGQAKPAKCEGTPAVVHHNPATRLTTCSYTREDLYGRALRQVRRRG